MKAPPSANKATRLIPIGAGRSKRVLTGPAKRWMTRAIRAFRTAGNPIEGPTPCTVTVLASISRRRDLDNCLKLILDAMKGADVIINDNWVDDADIHRADGPAALVSVAWGQAPESRPMIEPPPEMELDAILEPAQRRAPTPRPRGPASFADAWQAALEALYKAQLYQPQHHPEDGWTRPVWVAHACAWRAGGSPDVIARACRKAAEELGGELPRDWDLERKASSIQERVETLPTTIRDLSQRGGIASGVARREMNARRDREILTLAAQDKSQRAIARALHISQKSVWRVLRRAGSSSQERSP